LSTVTDQLGHTVMYSYDASGQLTSVRTADGRVTAYEYSPAGPSIHALTAITLPGDIRSTIGYDSQGRLASFSGGGGATVTLTYGQAGLVSMHAVDGTTNVYLNHLGIAARVE